MFRFLISFLLLLIASLNISAQQRLRHFLQPASCMHAVPYGANDTAGHYAQSGDANIYYEVYGQGQTVVLLHGGVFGSIIEMSDFLDSLQKTCQVVAISTRGHGKSSLGTEPMSLEQRAHDAMAVINQVTHDSVTVIGFSDGGYTAYQLAAMYPRRIKKMVVIGAGELYPGSRTFNLDPVVGVSLDTAYWSQQRALMPEPDRLPEVFRQVYSCYSQLTVGKELLGSIKCPVLVLAGDRDNGCPVELVISAARAIPQHQIGIIPNCTHTVFLDNFGAVWASVTPFLLSEQ